MTAPNYRMTSITFANGRDKVISRDSEGNGVYETIETLTVTLHADGSRTSALEVTNTDGSLRAHTLYTQSEDTLSRTILENLDGDLKADGTQDVDQKTVDVTTIATDGTRTQTITVTNADGSINGKSKTVLAGDKVGFQRWVDINQDGVFQATDLVESVIVNASTDVRTATSFDRSADGTLFASETSTTSANGLSITTLRDQDGDGDADVRVSDTTFESDGTSVHHRLNIYKPKACEEFRFAA
jgi:hypothetical protein